MFLLPRFYFRLLATAFTILLPLSLSAGFAQEIKKTPQKAQTSKPTASMKKAAPVHHATKSIRQTTIHRTHKMCKTPLQQKHHPKRKVLQCVGYVHIAAPNFKIHGDAHTWWKHADEQNYAKGHIPVPGSVLSFRATKKMFYGHVAMVRTQEDDRTIRIDHAHWGIDGVDHNVRCVDVSKNNDWTAVRVALRGNEDLLGSVYPTNGFIYPWTKLDAEEREKHLRDKPFGNRPTAHVKFKLPS